ncbi:Adaptive-response sensory-kinase SasA [Cellulomonas sp. T2.31MG-18]|uniref:HAMP domain-containing sensor histidine kinase n=1 Tax=Cellulomonas sp. T2.31MG-18 TaxID=3157619 RepID=UPI0035EBBBF9
MRRLHLTIRARLTLLATALSAAAGGVVVASTYALVASTLPASKTVTAVNSSQAFAAACRTALADGTADANLREKCQAAFKAGVKVGAEVQSDTTLSHLLTFSLVTLATATILTALASWFVVGRVLRRIQRITDAARAASDTNLSERVALQGPHDEVYELGDTFNAMLARLDASFTGQRRFIANASHELRTPLTVISTSVDVALAKPSPSAADLGAMALDVREAANRATALIDALLTLARTDRALTDREPVDLATVVEDVVDSIPHAGVDVDTSLDPARTTGDPVLLERLVANLVDNAVRYNHPDGRVAISTRTDDASGRVVVEVANSGPVVPATQVEGLFEPFRRLSDRTGPDGFGLGLAIVASITSAHSGTLTAAAPDTGGLVVTVTLP